MDDLGKLLEVIRKSVPVAAWGLLACITYITISPVETRTTFSYSASVERCVVFAALGILFCLAYSRSLLLVCVIVIGSAVALEILQLATADRHARVIDAIEKIVGGSLGVIAARSAVYLQGIRRRAKPADSQRA
jgi:hypothetical protein